MVSSPKRRDLARISGAEEKVSAFAGVELGDQRYLFLVVGETLVFSASADRHAILDGYLQAFGRTLKRQGKVVRTYPEDAQAARDEVLKKDWPDKKLLSQMESFDYPFLLVIDQDFRDFDPQLHEWAIIWLLKDIRADEFDVLFGRLAAKVRDGEGVFDYIRSVAKKRKMGRLFRLIKLKTPEAFGVSIDFQPLIDETLQRL